MYYKVVFCDRGGRLWSVMFNTICSSSRVEYKIGEWAYPLIPFSRLFVFSDYFHARKFAGMYGKNRGIKIFECEAKEPEEIKCISASFVEYEKFWEKMGECSATDFLNETRHLICTSSLAGTRVCSAAKLIKEVKEVKEVKEPF